MLLEGLGFIIIRKGICYSVGVRLLADALPGDGLLREGTGIREHVGGAKATGAARARCPETKKGARRATLNASQRGNTMKDYNGREGESKGGERTAHRVQQSIRVWCRKEII